MSSSRPFALCGTMLLLLASAACQSDVDGEDAAKGLDDRVCTQSDIGPDFNHQTAGGFTPANLGGLVDGDGLGERELKAQGLVSGHFVYWKEVVEKPPFQPPIDVVCQVMEFRNEAEASSFAARLKTDRALLRGTVIGLLPDARAVVSEVLHAGGGKTIVIQLTGESDAGLLAARIAVESDGTFVLVVVTATENEGRIGALSDELAQRVRERLNSTAKGP